MTQYMESVRKQKIKIEAEKWANQIAHIHSHSLSSMWYDNRPQDTQNGSFVCDVMYNDGRVVRTIRNTGETVVMNTSKQKTGEELVYEYERHNPVSS